MASREFQSLKLLLPDVLSRLTQDSGNAKALAPVWEEAAGPLIARHATPSAWEGNALVLTVPHARWVRELLVQEPALRARLAILLGKQAPTQLVFRLAK